MSCPFNDEQLAQLKAFVNLCKEQPLILQNPKLAFFKDYLVSLGVSLPTATFGAKNFSPAGDTNAEPKTADPAQSSSDEESEPESDVELDMEGVIESVALEGNQEMGDPDKEPTDEERDQSDEKRSEAMMAFSEQDFDKAIALYTEAIQLNPQSALLFAKRGQVYLKQNKLDACIKDCTRALELNCDSAAGYKFRGRAYRLLGKFEEASHDLCESLKIDYDDQANEWLAEIKPNAEKLRQHKLSMQRKKEEREKLYHDYFLYPKHREKLRRARKAQEARAQARAQQAAGGAAPDMGTFANMTNSQDFANLFSDPELFAALGDPEVSQMIYDVSSNPSNYIKYQGNPKFAAILEMLQKKMGKGGAGGRGPGEFPGFGGAGATPPTAPKSGDDDVGLD